MSTYLKRTRVRAHASGWLLAVLLFRAYIPVGFMPASGAPFLLEICPAGLAMQMPAHHAHHGAGGHGHFENCPFGSAPAAGPVSDLLSFDSSAPASSQPTLAFEPAPFRAELQNAHRARAPPILA